MRIYGDEPIIEEDSPVACYELYVNTIRQVESNAYIIILSYCLFNFFKLKQKRYLNLKLMKEGRSDRIQYL